MKGQKKLVFAKVLNFSLTVSIMRIGSEMIGCVWTQRKAYGGKVS